MRKAINNVTIIKYHIFLMKYYFCLQSQIDVKILEVCRKSFDQGLQEIKRLWRDNSLACTSKHDVEMKRFEECALANDLKNFTEYFVTQRFPADFELGLEMK